MSEKEFREEYERQFGDESQSFVNLGGRACFVEFGGYRSRRDFPNDWKLHGRPITVSLEPSKIRDTECVITDIPSSLPNGVFKKVLSKRYGEIISFGRPKTTAGFVEFASVASAKKLVSDQSWKLDGCLIKTHYRNHLKCLRSMWRSKSREHVEESNKRSRRSSEPERPKKEEKWCFIWRLPPIGDLELLRTLTERYGPVKSLHRPDSKSKFALVEFEDANSAAKLVADRWVLKGSLVNVHYDETARNVGGRENCECILRNIPKNVDIRCIVENRFGTVTSFRMAKGRNFGFLTFADIDSARALVQAHLWEVNGNIVYAEYLKGTSSPQHSRSRSRSRSPDRMGGPEKRNKIQDAEDDGFGDFVWDRTSILLQSAAKFRSSDVTVPYRAINTVEELEDQILQARNSIGTMENIISKERARWDMELAELEKQIEQEKRAWAFDLDFLRKLYEEERLCLVENTTKL
jgi:hypothetical protein